jgi:hypothetical protein
MFEDACEGLQLAGAGILGGGFEGGLAHGREGWGICGEAADAGG